MQQQKLGFQSVKPASTIKPKQQQEEEQQQLDDSLIVMTDGDTSLIQEKQDDQPEKQQEQKQKPPHMRLQSANGQQLSNNYKKLIKTGQNILANKQQFQPLMGMERQNIYQIRQQLMNCQSQKQLAPKKQEKSTPEGMLIKGKSFGYPEPNKLQDRAKNRQMVPIKTFNFKANLE